MYRIAVVGDRDSIYGFASVGLEIFPVDEGREALRTLKNLADNDYAIIYVTEALYTELDAEAVQQLANTAATHHQRAHSVSAAERRHQRLASGSARDKRISYGCVNAPEAFYNQHIAPLFGQGPGVVYVLPDTEPFATFFIAANAYP